MKQNITRDIKRLIKEYCIPLYPHKFNNLAYMNHKLSQFTQYVKDSINSPITIKEIEFIIYKSLRKMIFLENYNKYLRRI